MTEETLMMALAIVPAASAAILLIGFVWFAGALVLRSRYKCQILTGTIGAAVGAAAVASVI